MVSVNHKVPSISVLMELFRHKLLGQVPPCLFDRIAGKITVYLQLDNKSILHVMTTAG